MGSSDKILRARLGRPPLVCLVCGIDSGPVRTFLFLFIGILVGSSLLAMVWAYVTHRLKDGPEMAQLALRAEDREFEVERE